MSKLTPVEAAAHREREMEKFWRDCKWQRERRLHREGVVSWGIIKRDTGWKP